jgi:hypothetical protein
MGKFYKINGLNEKCITLVMGKVMLHNFSLVLPARVGIPILRESGGSTLRGNMGARGFLVVCVHGPFAARGLRGKMSTPSVGWEVSGEVSEISRREVGRMFDNTGIPTEDEHLQ